MGTAFSKGGATAGSKFVPAVSAAGREAISGATTGAFNNTANYLTADINHTVTGTVSSLTQGALWGGGTAGLGARVKVSQWVPGFAPVEELAEKSMLRNSVTNVVTDSLSGGVNSAGTYLSAPAEQYGQKNIEGVKDSFTKGAVSGSLKSSAKSSAPLVKEGSLKGMDFVMSPLHNIQNINRLMH